MSNKITPKDTSRVHRIGPRVSLTNQMYSRQIIVQFRDYKTKSAFIKERKTLRTKRPNIYVVNPKQGTSLRSHAKYEETTRHPRLLDLRWTDCHQRPAWENKNSQQRRRTEHIVDVNHCPPKSKGPLTHWLVTYPEL